ncbi:MAG: hypothetical protein ACTHY0_03960, partial [Mammaliicoccus vitulinus]
KIKEYSILIILAILFILSFLNQGYIFNIPMHDLLIIIAIIALIKDGIKEIKNKKNKGLINIFIALGLIFMLIKKYR